VCQGHVLRGRLFAPAMLHCMHAAINAVRKEGDSPRRFLACRVSFAAAALSRPADRRLTVASSTVWCAIVLSLAIAMARGEVEVKTCEGVNRKSQ
jgi:hypothetical protein